MVFRTSLTVVGLLCCFNTACSESIVTPAEHTDVPEDVEPSPTIQPFDEHGACKVYDKARRVSTLPPELNELSGLAVSRRHCDVAWGHNDSGDGPTVYAVRISTGELLSVVELEGISAYDWEDMALGACGDSWCLYLADIGDNLGNRASIQIQRIEEPDPFVAPKQRVTPATMDAVYDKGAHDAEALFVVGEHIYILSKAGGESLLFSAPFEVGEGKTFVWQQTLSWREKGARSGFMATGADYAENPPRLLVRAYFQLIEFVGEQGDDVTTLFGRRARIVPTGMELQSEAVAYGPGGYIHSPESTQAPLWSVTCAGFDVADCCSEADAARGWECSGTTRVSE